MPGQRAVEAKLARPRRGGGRRGLRRPRGRRHRPGRGAPRARSPGSSRAPCTAAASSSPAPAPRRAGWRDASPRSAPTSSSCRRSGSCRGSTPPRCASAVDAIHTYALVCLTSPNGVRLLFEALAAAGRDARALANATVAAIGPGTAAALRDHGVIADVVPERSVAEALVEALAEVEVFERPVLVARAAEARDVLPDALRERGAEVDVVALYETVAEDPDPDALEAARRGRLRDVHLVVDRAQLRRRGRRPTSRRARASSRSAR